MNDNNYVKIEGWMFNRLKLDTTSAVIFGMIYGFTKSDEKECSCSLKYFAESINRTKQTVINIIKKFIANGIVLLTQKRASDGGLRNYYRVNINKLKEMGIEETSEHHKIKAEKPENFTPDNKNFEQPQSKNQNKGSQNFRPNSNSTYNPITYTYLRTHGYGKNENVLITEQNYQELRKHFGEQFEITLESLSKFLSDNPKAYKKNKKTHLEVLNEWCAKDIQRSQGRKTPAPVSEEKKESVNAYLEKMRELGLCS